MPQILVMLIFGILRNRSLKILTQDLFKIDWDLSMMVLNNHIKSSTLQELLDINRVYMMEI
jgi:hypothetical protein